MTRVVIRSPDWLGDAVMALSAIRAVRRHFPDARLTVAALRSIAPLHRLLAGVDEVTAFDRGAATEREALRSGAYDIGLLLKNSFASAWRMWRAGVPERWGYRTDLRGLLLTRGVSVDGRRGRGMHQSEYYVTLVRKLGIDPGTLDATISVPAAFREAGRRLLALHRIDVERQTIVGLAPGAAYGHAKRWPPEYVAELVGQLEARGVTSVLVGASGDQDAGLAIESATGQSIVDRAGLVNLIGHTDLETLIGLLTWCRAFVSNDSGAMHLAAAVGCPVTAIFGPTDERVTSPVGRHRVLKVDVRCRPCMLRECPIDHRCMRRITPERVLAAVLADVEADARQPDMRMG